MYPSSASIAHQYRARHESNVGRLCHDIFWILQEAIPVLALWCHVIIGIEGNTIACLIEPGVSGEGGARFHAVREIVDVDAIEIVAVPIEATLEPEAGIRETGIVGGTKGGAVGGRLEGGVVDVRGVCWKGRSVWRGGARVIGGLREWGWVGLNGGPANGAVSLLLILDMRWAERTCRVLSLQPTIPLHLLLH